MSEDPVSILDKLRAYVSEQPDGATLDWLSVEQASGVQMDQIGRNALRQACRSERRPYEGIRGRLGIVLSSSGNALQMSRNKTLGVAAKAHRAQKFSALLLSKHEAGLTEQEKQTLLRDISISGTVRQAITFAVPVPLPTKVPEDPKERVKGALQMIRKKSE